MLRVLLVRHGQSEWNLSGRWQGQADPPLTDLGRTQARSAARALGTVDAIWTSDLQRAAETAAIVSAELGVGPVVIDPDLRERDAGEWSGLTRDQIDQQYPGYLQPLDGQDAANWAPRHPPGWEPDAHLAGRIHRVLCRIAHEVGDGDVLAVAHAGLLYTLERELGADGTRLANLDGRWVQVASDVPAAAGNHDRDTVRLSDICLLGDRLSLLPSDEITVPGQI
jgi:broad specificity phosphatase PhoE